LLPAAAILATDPPIHTSLRRRVAAMFAPRRIAELRPALAQAAQRQLSGFVNAHPHGGDLLSGFVAPFALDVVCELFRVPKPYRHRVFQLGDPLTDRTATSHELAVTRAACEQLIGEIAADSDGELFTQLDGSADNDAEIVNLVIALLVGGRGSPTVFASSALFALLAVPARYRGLVERPDRIPAAVEELLRWVPVGVGGGFTRVAVREVELGSVVIAAGDAVIPAMHAANRDTAVFERPEELVLDRAFTPHLSFGHGAHYCIGAGLARLEAQAVLQALITSLPGLTLAADVAMAVWQRGRVVRQLAALEVTW
jgi:nocardicin N-oxygenase